MSERKRENEREKETEREMKEGKRKREREREHKEDRKLWGPKEMEKKKHVNILRSIHHSGVTVVTRQATHRSRERREAIERERERERERGEMKEMKE